MLFKGISLASQRYQLVHSETKRKCGFNTNCHLSIGNFLSASSSHAMSFLMLSPSPLFFLNTSHLKDSWQKYGEANKDTNDCSRRAAFESAFITSHFCQTHKLLMKLLLCDHDGLHSGLQGSRLTQDSQRSVMNIHMWSVAGPILGEIEQGRKMNIESMC